MNKDVNTEKLINYLAEHQSSGEKYKLAMDNILEIFEREVPFNAEFITSDTCRFVMVEAARVLGSQPEEQKAIETFIRAFNISRSN